MIYFENELFLTQKTTNININVETYKSRIFISIIKRPDLYNVQINVYLNSLFNCNYCILKP